MMTKKQSSWLYIGFTLILLVKAVFIIWKVLKSKNGWPKRKKTVKTTPSTNIDTSIEVIFPSNTSLSRLSTQTISFAPLSIDLTEASLLCPKCEIYVSATSDISFKCPKYSMRILAENVIRTFTIKPSLKEIAWFTMFQPQIEH